MPNTIDNEIKNSTEQDLPISRLGLSLFVILAGSFLAPLLMHSSVLAIPVIATELQLTAQIVSWFTLAQVLAAACFVLPAGKLADRFGRRKMFVTGLAICCVACLVGGSAFNGYMILAARALQGIGGSLIFASAIALLVSVPPDDQKVKVMGIYISVAYVGVVSGPLFGGFVIQYFDWRWVFIVPGVVFLGLTIVGATLMTWERYGDRNTRLRVLDVSLYIASLLLLAFGIFDAASLMGQSLIAGGALSFTSFCWFQSKRKDPLLQAKLFTESRTFTILGTAHFLTYVSIFALPFTLTLFLQYLKGVSPQTTGFILLSQALCTSLVAPFSGWFAKHFRARHLIFFGTALFVTACLILANLTPASSAWLVVIAIALIGTSVGLMDAPIVSTSMSTVSPDLLGSASATMNGLRTMGGFVGIGIVSYLMGVHLGDATIEPVLYPQLMQVIHQFFIVAAAFSLLSVSLLIYAVVTRPRVNT